MAVIIQSKVEFMCLWVLPKQMGRAGASSDGATSFLKHPLICLRQNELAAMLWAENKMRAEVRAPIVKNAPSFCLEP